MKKALFITAIFFLTIVVFNSCSKYEDGPGISLRSKKARMENTWKIEKITDLNTGNLINQNDFIGIVDTTGMTESLEITFDIVKDGKIDLLASVSGFPPLNVASGTWEFVGDNGIKISITFINSTLPLVIEGTILRLANNELWIKDKDNYQLNLVSAY